MPGRSNNTANPNDNYKFTGHEQDDEAELTMVHMNARGYDPLIGRFNQMDPLMEFTSPYTYVGNNPLGFTDPTGMSSCGSSYVTYCGEDGEIYASSGDKAVADLTNTLDKMGLPNVDEIVDIIVNTQSNAGGEGPSEVYGISSGSVQLGENSNVSYTYNHKDKQGKIVYFLDQASAVLQLGESMSVVGANIYLGEYQLFERGYFDKSNSGTKKLLPELATKLGTSFFAFKDIYNQYVDESAMNMIAGFSADKLKGVLLSTDIDVYSKRYKRAIDNFRIVQRIHQKRVFGASNGNLFVFENIQIREYHNQ